MVSWSVRENKPVYVKNIEKQEDKNDALVEKMLKNIMYLESSNGLRNYSKCESIGKFNRYGFGIPGNGQYRCFDLDEDSIAVKDWIKNHLDQGFSERKIYCHYNKGTYLENCNYANKALNLPIILKI